MKRLEANWRAKLVKMKSFEENISTAWVRSALFYVILILVITGQQQVRCWRLNEHNDDYYQLNSSISSRKRQSLELNNNVGGGGWRSLQLNSNLTTSNKGNGTDIDLVSAAPLINRPTAGLKSGKLIEWDDDELNETNEFHSLRDNNNQLEEDEASLRPRRTSGDNSRNAIKLDVSEKPWRSSSKRQHQMLRTNRLVYHGQLRHPNSTRVRITDSLSLSIDTHKPVAINRRSFSSPITVDRAPSYKRLQALLEDDVVLTTRSPLSIYPDQYHDERPLQPTIKPRSHKSGQRDTRNSLIQDTAGSSSDWRPIVIAASSSSSSRGRRSSKTNRQSTALANTTTMAISSLTNKIFTEDKLNALDHKWKPLTNTSQDGVPVEKRQTTEPVKQTMGWRQSLARKIEEPFDSEDEEPVISASRGAKSSRIPEDRDRDGPDVEGEQLIKRENETFKWKPLDTSTQSSLDLMLGSSTTIESMTSETTAPTPRLGVSGSNSSDSVHRSASDLNYIYSSQPQTQPQTQLASSGSSYYSNYLVPASQPVEQPPLVAPLIDTTSGQLPEMVADRQPDLPPVQTAQDYYSIPQSMANQFQPAPAPPVRAPSSYYNSNNYAYDTSSYQSAANSVRGQQLAPPIQQQQQQVVSRQTQQSPVIRQEHHYHYYNQQPQSTQPERTQQVLKQQQQQQQQVPQPTVIRELQPIMISQPMIQQPSSTTPAPATQIIREIVREVPMVQLAPTQVPRVTILQQPVQPVPIQMNLAAPPSLPMSTIIRDTSFDSYGSYAAPAKRLMRQLTSSMPQVAIRMPSQFRVQVPAIQLPSSMAASLAPNNLAPVTRQTGSFIIPPMPKKTTTLMTETQAVPTHTTIMQTTQFTPATRTTVYTTDHQISNDQTRASVYR